MPAARFRVAMCDYLRGYASDAVAQWRRLAAELPDDPWGKAAARAQQMAADARDTAKSPPLAVPMPKWDYGYETNQQRGMSYGMMLFEHHMPLYALKEMFKICHGIYKKPGPLLPQARFRAGVCCLALGKPLAAARQWQMCRAYWPDSPWAAKAQVALDKIVAPGVLPAAQRVAVLEALRQPPLPVLSPDKNSPQQRFHVAEELFRIGILDDDQCYQEYMKVLSVTDPGQKKNKPFKPMAELRAGQCLLKTGRPQAAGDHFSRVVKLYPDTPAAAKARQLLAKGG